jgi:hypothetical protein
MGHLGFGLPMANAASSCPDRIVCINGDGMMGASQGGTAAATASCDRDLRRRSRWGIFRPLGEQIFRTRASAPGSPT